MPANDATMDDACAYGSDLWCAQTLGKSKDWLYRNRVMLELDGFPPKDPLVRLTLKDDVLAWIANRRRIADDVRAPITTTGASTSKENLNAF